MAMMARETWTDERLDDLKDGMHREFAQVRSEMRDGFERVDRRFEAVDQEIRDLRTDMNERFDKVDARFEKVDERFQAVDARFDALNARFDALIWVLLAAALSLVGAILVRGLF
jgi:predicted nuclease with TOPRIM domain